MITAGHTAAVELTGLGLRETCDALHRRRFSPVELLEATFARLDEANRTLNAVVSMRDRDVLLGEAREAETRIAGGSGRPLEGVPLGVKDLEDAAGLPTTQGSLVFRDRIAGRDSVQVERLRSAGAIVLGKTNAPEFGFTAITKNLVYGVTRSPWDPERTPGGSSGGSAAAIAGGLLALVTASDGGGSIRIPASFTGAFGLKPSFGRVPVGPGDYWESGDTACYGPLTRTVEDAALFLDQVVGPSPWDPNSLPHPGFSYLETLETPLPRPIRIGFSPDLGQAVVQSDVAAAIEEAAAVFEGLGHPVRLVAGGPPLCGPDWGLLGSFELASRLHPWLADHEGDFMRAFFHTVKMGWRMTPEHWGHAARLRAQLNAWCADFFERYDLLLTPTVPYDPPPARGPFPEETEGRPQVPLGVAFFTIPFNLSWHPAATVRAGFSRAGLPVGMQLVGPRHRDDLVLQASRVFERERPWHPRWPEFPKTPAAS